MSVIDRLLQDFHFVEENKSTDEVEQIYSPNDDVIVRIGQDYVVQVTLITDRSLPNLVQVLKFVVVTFDGIEDPEWYTLDAFEDVEFEIFRKEQL